MGPGAGTLGLSFIAGVLTTLNPCVLPILPLLVCGAVSAHAFGLVALTLGMSISYVIVGMFVATLGSSIGLDADLFRVIAASMLIAMGLVMVSARLQQRFAQSVAMLGNSGHSLVGRIGQRGFTGQLLIGLLLGAAWSPCVGPTLGAAVLLASQGKDLAHVAEVMIIFGVGASIPLLVLGLASRELFVLWRGRMMNVSKRGKMVLGIVIIIWGIVMVSGLEKPIEIALIEASPDWLSDLTTKY